MRLSSVGSEKSESLVADKKTWLTSRLKLAFYDFCMQVPGAVGRCGTKSCNSKFTASLVTVS